MRHWYIFAFILLFYSCYRTPDQRREKRVEEATIEWENLKDTLFQKHKNALLIFSTTWCRPCRILETEVLDQDTVVQFLKKNFVVREINAEDSVGVIFAEKFRITSYPTLLYFNKKAKLLQVISGIEKVSTPADFINYSNGILHNPRPLIAQGISDNFDLHYPTFYTDYFEKHAVPDSNTISSYLKTQEDWFNEINWSVISVLGEDTSYLNFIANHAKRYIALYGSDVRIRLNTILQSRYERAIQEKDSSLFQNDLNTWMNINEDLPEKELINKYYARATAFYAETGINWQRFLELWKQYKKKTDGQFMVPWFNDLILGKQVARKCKDYNILVQAIDIINNDIKNNQNGWQQYTLLGNLAAANNNLPLAEKYFNNAIFLAKSSKDTERIVFDRIGAAIDANKDSVLLGCLRFTQKYMPDFYKHDLYFVQAQYYANNHRWHDVVSAINRYQTVFGLKYDPRANGIIHLAKLIENNSTDRYCLTAVLKWTDTLLEQNPNDISIKNIQELTSKKLKLFSHNSQ